MTDDVKKASMLSAARLIIAIIGTVAAALGHHTRRRGGYAVRLSPDDISWNVARMRACAETLARGADALEAWARSRGIAA
jgi:hypothetical protein